MKYSNQMIDNFHKIGIAVLVFFYGISPHLSGQYPGNKLAMKPPLGWNSFVSYGVYLHQKAAMENLEAFALKLAPHGYEYFVIDAGWFGEFKLLKGTLYPLEKHAAALNYNEFGLLQPSECYFPDGIQPVIDRCHSLGLKFGLHLMRGIPREVVRKNLPVKDTKYHARDIADTTSICTWNPQNYGVDMDKPGAQEFYNSLIYQMADWGVDFIKYDDIVPYPDEVEAVVKAIEKCGRPIILSLSPGNVVPVSGINIFKKANMLRVTADIWDDTVGINKCFTSLRKWTGQEQPGFWIDMDMIPFGQLQIMSPHPDSLRKLKRKMMASTGFTKENDEIVKLSGKGYNRWCQLTKDQMLTFITIRAVSASPLMVGGDLPTLDSFSLSLITNKHMLECNQNGIMAKLLSEKNGIEAWYTPSKTNPGKGWIAVFNRSPEDKKFNVSFIGPGLHLDNNQVLFSIWDGKQINMGQEVIIKKEGVLFLKF